LIYLSQNIIIINKRDSHSSCKSDYDKKRKAWPVQLAEINNMTLWNFAIGGSVVDLKMY